MSGPEIVRRPATVAILPWLNLAEGCEFGGVQFLPIQSASTLLADSELVVVKNFARRYWLGDKATIRDYTIAHLTGKSPTAEMSAEEVDHVFAMVSLLAFAGLSSREFFSHRGYCNTHTFRLTIASATDPPDYKGYRVTARRRDGSKSIGTNSESYKEMKPHHVDDDEVKIDAGLLAALQLARESSPEGWMAIEEAIEGFNLANTDSPDVPQQTELVLVLGAMQRLLNTKSECGKLRKAFHTLFKPTSVLAPEDPPCQRCDEAKRKESQLFADTTYPSVVDTWLQDLCNLRGNVAHGKLKSPYVPFWSLRNHLLLAGYAFPLLVKALLQQQGYYALTQDDRISIDIFETLACEEHFGDSDSPWERIQKNAHFRIYSPELARIFDLRLPTDPITIATLPDALTETP